MLFFKSSVNETKTPLAATAAISPKGAKILFYSVELHLFAEIFPPSGGI